MKKIVFILAVAFTLQLSAQDKANWITDNATALKLSETQKKPVLVYVSDNKKSEASVLLKERFFDSEVFEKFSSNFVLLKLDVSDKQSYNVRLGIHYTKQKIAPGLSLIDKYGNTIVDPLIDFSSEEKILTFMTLLYDKL